MKRTATIATIALLLGLLILFTLPAKPDPEAPRFVAGQVRAVGSFTTIHYDCHHAPIPRDGHDAATEQDSQSLLSQTQPELGVQ